MATQSDVPDLDIEQVREDYEAIWEKNTVEVTLVRESNAQGGDYFHEDEEPEPEERTIKLNIQGISSDAYRKTERGIESAGAVVHAYALYDENIQNNDVVYFKPADKTIKFVIQNHNKSLYAGQVVFQEFDLSRVNVDDRNT